MHEAARAVRRHHTVAGDENRQGIRTARLPHCPRRRAQLLGQRAISGWLPGRDSHQRAPHPQLERRALRHEELIEGVGRIAPVGVEFTRQPACPCVQLCRRGSVERQKIQPCQCFAGEAGAQAAHRGREDGIVSWHGEILAEAGADLLAPGSGHSRGRRVFLLIGLKRRWGHVRRKSVHLQIAVILKRGHLVSGVRMLGVQPVLFRTRPL